jgi:polyhydroxyalkanoate synthesis repressor PhaR
MRQSLDTSDASRHNVSVSTPQAVRRIKRYGNRKLYDQDGRRYVTLEDLAAMVASGRDIEVIDQRTGEDLTSLTLAQVLLEGLKEKTARIPRQVLVRLVRLGAGPAAAFGDWPAPHEAATRAREEVEKVVGSLLSRGRLTLEEALALRQDVARSVLGIVSEAQAGIEGRIRGLFEALTPTPEPLAKKDRTRTARKNMKRKRRTA